MRKLDHYLDVMLEDHLNSLNIIKHLPRYLSYKPDQALKRYATVKFDVGPQTGKTYYIARSASDQDIIICSYPAYVNTMRDLRRPFVSGGLEPRVYGIKDYQFSNVDFVNDIWVDDASLLVDEELGEMYQYFAGKGRRFILIG